MPGGILPTTSDEKLAEINAYLKSGLKDKEAAKKAGVSVATITRWRARGKLVQSNKYYNEKPGDHIKAIDINHPDLPEMKPGTKMDGTPDTASPAFEDEGSDIPFAEPYEEPKPEVKQEKVASGQTRLTKTIYLRGNYAVACIDNDMKLNLCPEIIESKETARELIDIIIAELTEIRQEIDFEG